MQGITFIYISEAVLTGKPVVTAIQLETDAHPHFVRGRAGLAAVMFGITRDQLKLQNVALHNAIETALSAYGGEFIEARVAAEREAERA